MTTLIHIALLILATTAIHGLVTALLVQVSRRLRYRLRKGKDLTLRFFFLPVLVLVFLFVALLEASLWAWYYVETEQIPVFADGLYFSLITMTTLGYGDITLVGSGRLVSGMQGALGIVLFGWTTAIIFTAVQAVNIGERALPKSAKMASLM